MRNISVGAQLGLGGVERRGLKGFVSLPLNWGVNYEAQRAVRTTFLLLPVRQATQQGQCMRPNQLDIPQCLSWSLMHERRAAPAARCWRCPA